jgi:hypothetical protein
MPEFRESLAHFLLLFWLYKHYKTNWTLQALWADLTEAEVKHLRIGRDGLVQCLDNTCSFKRGSKNAQTALYPQRFRKTRSDSPPQDLRSLQLIGIDHSPRAIFLNFTGDLRFKVSIIYLFHY